MAVSAQIGRWIRAALRTYDHGMRLFSTLMLVLAACTGESLDAPDDCAADELHIIHGDVDERISVSSFAFFNALGGDDPGSLSIGSLQMPIVRIEFTKLAPRGATVSARGRVTLPSGLDVGDCETGDLDGLLHVDEDYWRFELVDVAIAPYCSGAGVADSVQGCFRAAPF